ncbi:MAG: succinylglutamate desuccinylase/aspartoacylase family protein [Burkholderiales bacterium]|jgi:predicted deacylase
MPNVPLSFKSVQFSGRASGPKLIVTGAVHGNETCGTEAISRVLADIESGRIQIRAGHVTFVPITNPLAYNKAQRNGDRNLNRNLYPVASPKDFEDHIANWLCPLLAQHEVLLDLHSTRAQNPGFAMLGPLDNDGPLQPFSFFEKERALASRLGVSRFVDGWLGTYALGVERRRARAASLGVSPEVINNALNTDTRYGVGTTEYMRSVGGYAITLECGQHDDPLSPEVGYRAILNTLAFLGISDGVAPPPVAQAEHLHMYEVMDRYDAEDVFAREWASFNPLRRGDLIATRANGAQIVAEEDGFIMFPDANAAPGNEWFYLARAD